MIDFDTVCLHIVALYLHTIGRIVGKQVTTDRNRKVNRFPVCCIVDGVIPNDMHVFRYRHRISDRVEMYDWRQSIVLYDLNRVEILCPAPQQEYDDQYCNYDQSIFHFLCFKNRSHAWL